jgi:hypothetical protein
MNPESENPYESPRNAEGFQPSSSWRHSLGIVVGFVVGLVMWPVVLLVVLALLGSFW